jgi:hypothetical protein
MRNVFFCLSSVFWLVAVFLFFNVIFFGEPFIFQGSLFIVLSVLAGYLAFYYHGRFRCRE